MRIAEQRRVHIWPVPDEDAPLTGRCLCGAVRFSISEPLLGAAYCHCKRCQRLSGTGFSISGVTEPGSFEIMQGDEAVGTYRPEDDGWHKNYCSECGSQLFSRDPANPELLVVRLGVLDQDPGIRPGLHQFVDYAPAWAPIPDDGLPRFPESVA